jgi:bacterioferritin (cytochrome b1)
MTSKSDIEIAQEIIGRSLFLFGAGATKDAGCLISSEMLHDIQKMDLSDPEKEALDFLLSALHYHSSWKNIKERKNQMNQMGISQTLKI